MSVPELTSSDVAIHKAGNLPTARLIASVVRAGDRVVVKPNLVLDENEGTGGMEPLVTDPALIRAAAEAALDAGAGEVVVGDAPIQKCRFDALLEKTGLAEWAAKLAASEPRFKGIRDFRRTTCVMIGGGIRVAAENLKPEDQFVLFDLGQQSLLEPISDDRQSFRVSWYDPRLMARTHHRGRHQYLVAKEVVDADVVINLPKLKTHRKAGITCALKNLIGINGNKEYLPHHRIGGSEAQGDCYPGRSRVKEALEYTADRQNESKTALQNAFWYPFFVGFALLSRWNGDRLGIDGSWSGNDTIWRTCLDLNRILLYGTPDGKLGETVRRRVIHIADANIAGQGDGPLAPDPLPMGLMLASRNACAMDYAGALLLGYDPDRIKLVRESFGAFRWPIAQFGPADVRISGDLGQGLAADVIERAGAVPDGIRYPIGWKDAAAPAAVQAR